ncbi:MAG: DNA repair protein RecN [Clostridia bacterium]|nr:DNA repair protein RecN [Clostridia bacterium]
MINSLYINNIAIISKSSINFNEGLNVLSGETGAGKSIIVDSINFVLGDRADKSLIKYGEKNAFVEMSFVNIKRFDEIKEILEDAGIEYDYGDIIISRRMSQDRTECRINNRIVTLSILKNIVSKLVDIHSQNEQISLYKNSEQLKVLDNYSKDILKAKEEFISSFTLYNSLLNSLAEYPNEEERERLTELYKYQVDEITSVQYSKEEEEDLINKRNKINNLTKINDELKNAINNLTKNDSFNASSLIDNAYSSIDSITKYDSQLEDLAERLKSAMIEIDDISDTLDDILSDSYNDNLNIEEIENRLDKFKLIKKKYGKTEEEINEYLEKITKDLEYFENSDIALSKITKQLKEQKQDLDIKAKKLHDLRVKYASNLEGEIVSNFKDLGMKNTKFKIEIISDFEKINNTGADQIEFLISPNPGEPLKPLNKIASGGEISRFLLAIKNVIADLDDIDTLIFDEIDTGISGNVAKEVSKKLYTISNNRQVICITHLPQLAAMADYNYLITKTSTDNSTNTQVNLLEGDEIFTELMRLSGAKTDSAIGLASAKELKNECNEYKSKVNK